MGRTMPTECEHGVVLDWGDFGPDPDDPTVLDPCPFCDSDRETDREALVAQVTEALTKRRNSNYSDEGLARYLINLITLPDPETEPWHAEILVEWWPSASIGEHAAVRSLLEHWCGQLMEQLLALGVTDPTVGLDGPPAQEAK